MEPNLQPPTPQDQPKDSKLVAEPEQVTKEPYFNEETFEQPEQTPVAAETPVTVNTFSSSPREILPENSSPTPLSSEQTVVTSTTPVDITTPETVVQPPKKKNLLWLWLTLGAVLLIVAGLLASFFVAKSAADTAASAYTGQVTSYLDDVYDAATSPATNPSDVQKAVEAIKAPVLASTPLGVVSGNYTAAEKLNSDVTNHVDTLTTKIKGYAQVQTFYTAFQNLGSDLAAIATTIPADTAKDRVALTTAFMTRFGDKLKELETLSTSAVVPADIQADVAELGRIFGKLHTDWSAMVSAYDSGNSTAYKAAYDNYSKDTTELSSAERPITEYSDALSSKTSDSAKELQAYRNTLK